jgi:hypothetical protein
LGTSRNEAGGMNAKVKERVKFPENIFSQTTASYNFRNATEGRGEFGFTLKTAKTQK